MKIKGAKDTKKGVTVNLDVYNDRKRYYQGDKAGIVILLLGETLNNLLKFYNDHFKTELDSILFAYSCYNEERANIKILRKGYIVQ